MVRLSKPTRSLEANSLMWVLLTAFAEQLQWPVNGKMVNLSPEEFKEILTAAFDQEEVRLASGLEGGVVMLGQRTSKYSTKKMSEFIEFLYATGTDRDVAFDEASRRERK